MPRRSLRVVSPAIRLVNPGVRLLGRAVTAQANADLMSVIAALHSAQAGDVLVVESGSDDRAVAGELFASEAIRRGVAGIVIDGLCRDTPTLRRLTLPVFARGATPIACPAQRVPVTGGTVTIGGVEVRPGDLLLGDDDGHRGRQRGRVRRRHRPGRGHPVRRGSPARRDRRRHAPSSPRMNYDEHLSSPAGRATQRAQPGDLTVTISYARRMSRVQPSAIRELLRLGADPEVTSFGGGYPDASLFPVEDLHAVFDALLVADKVAALQYTTSNGLPELRAQVADRLTRQGTPTTADDVLIIQGGQQGLDLTAKLVLDAGDTVVTENPTFLGALIAFNPCEPTYAAVRMDDQGMDTDHLAEVLDASPRAKMIYTVPDFQNPTGVTMSLPRRRRLIELANAYGLLVLEDTPYRDLRYDGEHLPTLRSLDTEGRVVHLGSFSKILAPGMRLGWAAADPELVEKLGLLKLAADTQSSTLNMAATSAYLSGYDIDAHIASVIPVYRHKRDLMLATMAATFPASVEFTRPDGGLFTWLTFPADFDAAAFLADRLLPEAKVAYVPGATFFPVTQQHTTPGSASPASPTTRWSGPSPASGSC